MNQNEKRLIKVLEQESQVYDLLAEIKQKERDALLDFSATTLEEVLHEQDMITNEAYRLEEERREVVSRLFSEKPNFNREPTLTDIAPMLSEDARSKAFNLRSRIRSSLESLTAEQATNATLISRSMEYMKDFINTLIDRAQKKMAAYGHDGCKVAGRESVPGLLDKTV